MKKAKRQYFCDCLRCKGRATTINSEGRPTSGSWVCKRTFQSHNPALPVTEDEHETNRDLEASILHEMLTGSRENRQALDTDKRFRVHEDGEHSKQTQVTLICNDSSIDHPDDDFSGHRLTTELTLSIRNTPRRPMIRKAISFRFTTTFCRG